MTRESVLTGSKVGSPPVDLAISAFTQRQHGLIRAAQLREVGLSTSAVSKRVDRGRLHRRHRGIYSVGPLSREAELLAAVFLAGEGAVLSHLAAAELHGLWRYRASLIDVVAPKWRTAEMPVRVHECRNLHPRDVTTHKGIPVTSIPRLFVDLTDVLIPEELTTLIHEAAFKGRFSLPATLDAIQRANGRHNLHVLHEALALHQAGSAGLKSRNEKRLLLELRAAGIPDPLVNHRLHGFEVDFHWPDFRLVVEADGPGHTRPRAKRDDEHRDRVLTAAGYTTIRIPSP